MIKRSLFPLSSRIKCDVLDLIFKSISGTCWSFLLHDCKLISLPAIKPSRLRMWDMELCVYQISAILKSHHTLLTTLAKPWHHWDLFLTWWYDVYTEILHYYHLSLTISCWILQRVVLSRGTTQCEWAQFLNIYDRFRQGRIRICIAHNLFLPTNISDQIRKNLERHCQWHERWEFYFWPDYVEEWCSIRPRACPMRI